VIRSASPFFFIANPLSFLGAFTRRTYMLHGAAEESPALYPFSDFVFRLRICFFGKKMHLGLRPKFFSFFPLFSPRKSLRQSDTDCVWSLSAWLFGANARSISNATFGVVPQARQVIPVLRVFPANCGLVHLPSRHSPVGLNRSADSVS
jgi:hypothetical protein